MPLVLNQLVQVRVAVVFASVGGDLSVGQVYDQATSAWIDVVWITSMHTWLSPQEFGDVEYYGRVTSLSTNRGGVIRPAVTVLGYISGGIKATDCRFLTENNASVVYAVLINNGTDITTNLPGLGAVVNQAIVYGYGFSRTGWIARLPVPLTWRGTAIAKSLNGHSLSTVDSMPTLVSGFSSSFSAFDSWLATNQPDWGSPFYLEVNVEYPLDVFANGTTGRVEAVDFRAYGSCVPGAGVNGYYTACRGGTIYEGLYSANYNTLPCPGGSPITLWSLPTHYPTTVAGAVAHVGALGGISSSAFVLPAAAGGTSKSTVRWNTNTRGFDVTLTISSTGKMTGIVVTPFVAGTVLTGWGVMLAETGGMP